MTGPAYRPYRVVPPAAISGGYPGQGVTIGNWWSALSR
jgi:hypothetical protein